MRALILGVICVIALAGLLEAGQKPDVVLLYTMDARGFLKTCGCSGVERASLAQTATLIRDWRARYPLRTLVVDGGNIADSPRHAPVVWDSMRQSGYDAVSYGPLDAAWAGAYWPLVAANPIPVLGFPYDPQASGASAAEERVRRDRLVKQVGGCTVGLASIGPKETLDAEETKQLITVLRDLRSRCDLVLLFSHRWFGAERGSLKSDLAGLVDLVIGAPGSDSLNAPEAVGSAFLLPAAIQGRQVGVVRIACKGRKDAPEGARPPVHIEWSLVEPSEKTPSDPQVSGQVAGFLAAEQERLLRELPQRVEALERRGYVRPERCAPCHASQHAAWQASRHARAVRTLTEKRVLGADCLPCHSQAYRETRRLRAGQEAQGVECVTCHEGAEAHLKEPGPGNIARGSRDTCTECHTTERSTGFDKEAAWAKVKH